MSVTAAESLSVSTKDFGWAHRWFDRHRCWSDVVSLNGSDMSVSASESVSVSAGDSVDVGVVSDVDISSGGKLVGRVAESVEVVSGSASLASGSSIDVVSGEDVSVSAGAT